METQQEIIDKLIDYIDTAILKNSVSNRHVAAVLAFLNEELKNKNVDIDIESLKKHFVSKTEDSSVDGYIKFPAGISVKGIDISDSLNFWQKKQDPSGNPYLYTDLPIVTRSGLITYNDDGTINLPNLYDGLPLDGTTIGRDASGALTVLGGVGSDFDSAQMWAALSGSGTEQINNVHLTDALAGYARTSDIPSLTGYATEDWVNDKGYVTTTRLNELIGGASSAFDTLKEIEDYINSHESVTAGLIASLGNKVDKVTGMGLSEHSFTTSLRDKLNSIAEGANKYILPVAQAAVMGGVMIGSNINVNAQGVISVVAPYSHPTQQVITVGGTRHFLTGLSVNDFGHVTSATSAALTKADLLSVLRDQDGVIRLDAHMALTGGLINYANLGAVNIPSLYDGLPVDGTTIYWENGTLKSSSTAGGGLAKVIVKVGLAAYESVDGVVTLPAYPTMPDLSGFVTLNTSQIITGQKTFTAGIWLNHTLIADAQDTVSLYTKEFGGQGLNLRSLLVSADYSYRQYVPDQGAYFVGDVKAYSFAKHGGASTQFLKADGSVDGNSYAQLYHIHSDLETSDLRNHNPNQFSNKRFTPFFLDSVKLGLYSGGFLDALYLNTYPDGSGGHTNLIALSKDTGEMYRMLVYQGSGSWNGNLVKMIDSSNWQSIVDGRYLPLSGGTLTGDLRVNARFFINSDVHHLFYNSAIGCISSKYGFAVGDNLVWHAGNDGTGSGLDADLLDGLNSIDFGRYFGAAGFDANEIPNGVYGGKLYDGVNFPYNFYSFLSVGNGVYKMQFNGAANELQYRSGDDNGLFNKAWRIVAFSDSNVASATKLQTPRTIFGQPFDGTGDISGDFHVVGSTFHTGAYSFFRRDGVSPGIYIAANHDGSLSINGHLQFGYTKDLIKIDYPTGTTLIRGKCLVASDQLSPTISLAIGDHDTGFDWASDGVYKLKSNAGDVAQVSPDRFHLYKKLVIESNEGNYCEGIRIKASSNNWSTIALGAVGEFGTSENMWSIHRTADNNFAIARNDSSGVNGMFIGKNGNVGFGTVTPTEKLTVNGWLGSIGSTGWYNTTFSGGMYMADSEQVRVYGNKVLYNDGFRVWGIGGHCCGLKLYNQHHIGINLANAAYTWGIYANSDGNMYIGRRNGDVNDLSGSYYLIIGAGTMTYNGSIVLNGGGLVTYSSDMRLKNVQEYFKPSIAELAALPVFVHSWLNDTPGVQLSTSAQAVRKIMPWNVFEGDDGYLKMDGTRTALAVSIRLAQLAHEYIIENDRWKSDKDRQIEALQREVKELKQQLNVA